ncbi:MAG: CAAX prenyl protease-related protein [Nitrospirota bacterium]|nr:CAAX prenyl protease-related protein [Nitrospirota bacterium]
MWPRILPFAAYMAFIGVSSLLPEGTCSELWLYPVKTAVVLGLLVYFGSAYSELHGPIFADAKEAAFGIGVGILVYVLWVQMDWPWATQGEITGYNPFEEGAGMGWALAAVRIFGASIVVPLMEELFWRSFLIRWVVNPDFEKVAFGTFTLASFAATVVLFGLEHNLWLAGMMAGVAYNGLYYKTRRLWPCVVAHATTNFILGLHVLATQEWQWW